MGKKSLVYRQMMISLQYSPRLWLMAGHGIGTRPVRLESLEDGNSKDAPYIRIRREINIS